MLRLEKIQFASILCLFIAFSSFNNQVVASKQSRVDENMQVWLETSLKRIFPQFPGGTSSLLELDVARNSRVSFQVGFHSNMKDQTQISCAVDASELQPIVRYVGLVPFHHFNTDVRLEELEGVGYLPGLTAGINPDDSLLSSLKSYEDFPKDGNWLQETLKQILISR